MYAKCKGISLIEVLVTALVLGVGLLGVAALQLTSVNSSQEGYFRSQATEIAESLASKMRTARFATYDDGATTVANVINAYVGGPYACQAAVTNCSQNQCSPAEMVAFDQWEVCQQAESELPEGGVYVQNVSGIRARIAVAWTTSAARADLGQVAGVVNPLCANFNLPNGQDCVILEIVP